MKNYCCPLRKAFQLIKQETKKKREKIKDLQFDNLQLLGIKEVRRETEEKPEKSEDFQIKN